MKLKTDRFMWLKNIKENRTDYLYWGYVAWIGFKQIDIYYEEQKRLAGKSNYTFKKC